MKVGEFLLLYAMLGAGAALVVSVRGAHHPADAALLFVLWPLYGPFLVLQATPAHPAASHGETAFLSALRGAAGTPLANLLPDEPTARALARRLRAAAARVAEIDALLARPDFSEDAVKRRQDVLRAKPGSERALATSDHRLQNIARLRALRNRFASELDEVEELLAQLTTQAEVVRLAGDLDASSAQLVRELVLRVEGLDEFLDAPRL